MNNLVNHPPYYGGDTTYEAIKVIEAWDLGFCLGNVIKYISRAGRKDQEKEIEDLEKSLWYLERRIKELKWIYPKFCVNTKQWSRKEELKYQAAAACPMPPCLHHNTGGCGSQGRRSRSSEWPHSGHADP